MSNKLWDQKTFIKAATDLHGGDFDYELVDYVNSKTPVIIKCNKHNKKFSQSPMSHMEGRQNSCPGCVSDRKEEARAKRQANKDNSPVSPHIFISRRPKRCILLNNIKG